MLSLAMSPLDTLAAVLGAGVAIALGAAIARDKIRRDATADADAWQAGRAKLTDRPVALPPDTTVLPFPARRIRTLVPVDYLGDPEGPIPRPIDRSIDRSITRVPPRGD